MLKTRAVESGTEMPLTEFILAPGQNKVELPLSGLKTGLNLIWFDSSRKGFVRKMVVVR